MAHEVYEAKSGAFFDYIQCEKKDDGKWHVNALVHHAFQLEKDMQKTSQWEKELIERIIERCKDLSADQLTGETHTSDSLWNKVVTENNIDFSRNPKTAIRLCLSRDARLKNRSGWHRLCRF